MDDLIADFLTETGEGLAGLDAALLRLEKHPDDPQTIGEIFRLIHTIKGTCGFLGLSRLEKVAHAGENVLGRYRDGSLPVTSEGVSLILRVVDRVREIMGGLEATGAEPAGDDSAIIAELDAVFAGKALAAEAAPEPAAPVAAEGGKARRSRAKPAAAKLPETMAEPLAQAQPVTKATKTTAAKASPARPRRNAAPKVVEAPPAEAVARPEPTPAPAAVATAAAPDAAAAPAGEAVAVAQTLRVNVDVLESLMTLVSELVLTRNQLLQLSRAREDSALTGPLQRLSHITSELQEGVMKTRMQPIGNAWKGLPRLVRDLARELGKKIELDMRGAETELDRQVLEMIRDPLTHMVRNSGDHGLEGPAERREAGKPEAGRITLDAYHEGGHIIIEVGDDGRGLPVEKIRAKALAQGLATEQELAGMGERDIQRFIFRAGFSTAAAVTSVSGRGVGMDVVRTNVEKIGGTIDLRSREGKGTTFLIKIPLTLAIVSALIVEAGGERFAIPQIGVVELVRAGDGVTHIKDAPVLRLRDRLLPLVSLSRLLRLEDKPDAEHGGFVVVTQVGQNLFGIIVDRVFDTEEIVVKPVAPILRHVTMFSGNTILGDGSVIMILDPNGIARATGVGAEGVQEDRRGAAVTSTSSTEKMSLLLFRAGSGGPRAVPLGLVARLEDLPAERIEMSHGQPVVQYRGALMPLVPISDGWVPPEPGGRQAVLVFNDGGRAMGLAVDEILDVVEETLKIESGQERSGYLGTAVIAGRATEVIDCAWWLRQAGEDWFGPQRPADARRTRLLVVEDSAFFRNMLVPALGAAGFEVVAAASGTQALKLREAGECFDAIVSDIEMPELDGLGLARAARDGGPWHDTPLIALTSHTDDAAVRRSRDAGFDRHVPKFDRDALLDVLRGCLTPNALH
ncbi:two-component system, chemotaxis family, sensor kinase CheA [Roseomonas rosea]|uniref:Chemotaxis protein CheA n=1 Tax=Muricoccus roseus TaxID=198092 RepID=A0A1M6BER6_9PROT|nr:chemotaxis protein CheW [Roseomonas rosea]SHI47231.1 two-component system, chemotaxis family, sensor kinase CheA [Roseomonas rosea]